MHLYPQQLRPAQIHTVLTSSVSCKCGEVIMNELIAVQFLHEAIVHTYPTRWDDWLGQGDSNISLVTTHRLHRITNNQGVPRTV